MRKKISLLVVLLCLLMTGCNNRFAESEYDSAEKISQKEDRYAKETSVFNTIEGGYSLVVSKFDGRQTLWSSILKENQDMEIEFSLSISEGQVKIVHIDEDDNITTLIECAPESSTDGFVTKTVLLKSGENRLKIVGYDCEDLDLTMLFDEP